MKQNISKTSTIVKQCIRMYGSGRLTGIQLSFSAIGRRLIRALNKNISRARSKLIAARDQ
jgi:hypothetical protein